MAADHRCEAAANGLRISLRISLRLSAEQQRGLSPATAQPPGDQDRVPILVHLVPLYELVLEQKRKRCSKVN